MATVSYSIQRTSIETDHIGLDELLKFYQYARQHSGGSITLDVTGVNHIDANLAAILLALSHKLRREKKVNVFIEIGKHQNVFFRNGLISHLAGSGNNNKYGDQRESTIALTTFDCSDDESYCAYLKGSFLSHRGLDNVPKKVKDSLRSHYIEVFTNVGLHANTTMPVYTCGQYFPEKNVLKFTLVDLGQGFLRNIESCTAGSIHDDRSAIIWATEGLNTTKDKSLFGPGGTGLKDLKRYCNANNGSLHICSGTGYVNMLNNRTLEFNLSLPFPGSIINIIMRKI